MTTHKRPLTAEQFSDLIGTIYDCAINPSLWPQTIGAIAEAAGCFAGLIGIVDLDRVKANVPYQWGYQPGCVDRMIDHLEEVIAGYRSLPLPALNDEPISSQRALPRELKDDSPYGRMLRGTYGIVDSIDLILIAEPGRVAELGLSRHESRGMVSDADLDVVRLLAPHIRRSITISDLLDMKSLEKQALSATLDSVAVGIVIVGDEGRILHSNKPAQAMLASGFPIQTIGGRLTALKADVTNELMRAITLAQTNEASIGKTGIGIPLEGRNTTAIAHVLPLAGGARRGRLIPKAAAAVFISPSDTPLPTDLSTIARIFALTAAENRLLAQFAAGASIAEAAAELGITEATAKTHRTHLFAKMGIKRRTELSALLARLVLPVERTR